MKNYYFLATALPPLEFGIPPEMDFEEFEMLLHLNLTPRDLAITQVVQRFYDIMNIRAFWKNEKMDLHGSLNEVDLEEALLSREGLPEYVYDFMDTFDSKEKRLQNFSALIAAYFREEIKNATGLLKEYLVFERDLRLILVGFRAKALGKDVIAELQFEDPYDDTIAQILAQKDAKTFVPPNGFQDLQPILEAHGNDPLGLHQALTEYRFHKLESLTGVDLFSLDRILAYMVRLILIEKWMGLDKHAGLAIADTIMKKVV